MTTIKTAISLQESLFAQLEDLAKNLQVSRSQVITLALEAFVERHKNQELLEALNQAYGDDSEQEPRSEAQRQHHRRMVEGEW